MFKAAWKAVTEYGAVATGLQFILGACGITTFASAVAIMIAWFDSVSQWLLQPHILISLAAFLAIFWSLIGIAVLRSMKQTKTIRLAHDYAYSFLIENYLLGLAKFPDDHPKHAGKSGVSIIANLRNVGQGPAHLKTEEVRFNLDERTPEDSAPIELVFARLALRGIKTATLPIDETKNITDGSLNIKVSYGPPDSGFLRTYSVKIKITVIKHIDENGRPSYHLESNLDKEKDRPYVPEQG